MTGAETEAASATPLVMIRHGPTDWNERSLIQGRSDRALSASGRQAVARWRLPAELASYRWTSSPLRRALETAALLGHGEAEPEVALIEMDWGAYEGQRLAELRQRCGEAFAQNEARGLDFRPDGGESPRAVQKRLSPWLARCAAGAHPTAAITHKGVIRALYALAVGWDMRGKPPDKLRDACAHRFRLAADGTPRVERLNIPLAP